MSEQQPKEKEERGPLWFRVLPRPVQYWLFFKAIEKLMKDPQTPKRISITAQAWEDGMRILQGKKREERHE